MRTKPQKINILLFHDPHDGQSVLIYEFCNHPPVILLWCLSCLLPEMTQILPACFGTQSSLALGRLDRSQIRGRVRLLNQLSLLFRPPGRGRRRAGPSEIKFHKLLQWYLLFTQQLNWLNNCLTPGLLAWSLVWYSYLTGAYNAIVFAGLPSGLVWEHFSFLS